MPLSLISVLAILSVISAAGVCLILTRKWWSLKNLKVSFPDVGESALSVFLKKTFGNAKLEKRISLWWGRSNALALRLAARFKESAVALKIKEKADHILGKSRAIPEKETSSVFLKSIAEHKKKTREEEEEEVESEKF